MEIQKNAHAGLALLPDEREYFPKEFIFSYRSVGILPESKDFEIVLFQLGVDVCPHLKTEDNRAKCGIYENRPLACQCFPLHKMSISESGQLDYRWDPNCKSIRILRRENPDKAIKLEASLEESGYKLLNRIQSIMESRIWVWRFDLKSKKWRNPYNNDI